MIRKTLQIRRRALFPLILSSVVVLISGAGIALAQARNSGVGNTASSNTPVAVTRGPAYVEGSANYANADLEWYTTKSPCVKDDQGGRCSHFPAAAKPAHGMAVLKKADVIQWARVAAGSRAKNRAEVGTAPVTANLMAYKDFLALSNQSPDLIIDPERPVWLVTVHTPVAGGVSPSHPVPDYAPSFIELFDGLTGQGIVSGSSDVLPGQGPA